MSLYSYHVWMIFTVERYIPAVFKMSYWMVEFLGVRTHSPTLHYIVGR